MIFSFHTCYGSHSLFFFDTQFPRPSLVSPVPSCSFMFNVQLPRILYSFLLAPRQFYPWQSALQGPLSYFVFPGSHLFGIGSFGSFLTCYGSHSSFLFDIQSPDNHSVVPSLPAPSTLTFYSPKSFLIWFVWNSPFQHTTGLNPSSFLRAPSPLSSSTFAFPRSLLLILVHFHGNVLQYTFLFFVHH